MKLSEACGQYHIDSRKLRLYARCGLIDPESPCSSEELERLCLISRLYEAGVEPERIKALLASSGPDRLRLLRLERCRLLEEIHAKQCLLDSLDYMIHEQRESEPAAPADASV